MRTRILAIAILLGCGARSELGAVLLDAEAVDATVADAAVPRDSGTSPEASVDAREEPALCCDLGVKQSGCQVCASGERCWNKVGGCYQTVVNCGPANCAGCCDTPTNCFDGREVGACGTGGQMCQTCFSGKSYGTCDAGVCVGSSSL